MTQQFEELGLIDKVEFFNAIDYSEIFPRQIFLNLNPTTQNFPILGCAISHYSCVSSAYEQGLNNILILEDDICFLKDKDVLEKYFNNLPKNYRYIKYVVTGFDKKNIPNNLYNNLKEIASVNSCAGAYALDRGGMGEWLQYQKMMKLMAADWVPGFYININKGYYPNKLIMTPQIFLEPEGKEINTGLIHEFNKEDFYLPNEFLISTINKNR